jgi:hypothetical protein
MPAWRNPCRDLDPTFRAVAAWAAGVSIALAGVFAPAGSPRAAEFRIVVEQPQEQADVTTHEIRSGDAVLGISEFGGGYINKLVLPGVGDVVAKWAARYGRGGQVSIRDRLHGLRYNPTQGGFTDRAGTYVVIEQPGPGRLTMPPRPVSLWNGDGRYDFTEWENLAGDPYRNDGGNSDMDGIDESRLPGKQADEITSEFDLTAAYEDARDGKRVRIPAFRFSYEFRFVREPGHAISQFRRGTPVYDAAAEVADRSNLAPPGNHPSAEDSLTGLILTSSIRGDKAVWDPDTIYFVGAGGELAGEPAQGAFRRRFAPGGRAAAAPLVIFARGADPGRGPAIGFYHPASHANQYAIVGRSLRDHAIAYEDQRMSDGVLLGNVGRTPDVWLFGIRTEHAGLLSRKETPPGVYEAIRGESYILIGTPREILEAAGAIHPLK